MPMWLAALFVALVLSDCVYAKSGEGSTESGKARDRKDKSKDLTDEKDVHGNNLLIATMINCSSELSGEEAVEWNALIEECSIISNNATLTSDEIIVLCASKIKIFFSKFSDVRAKFLYLDIGEWGSFKSLFQVAVWINADFTESSITIINGKFELEESLLEFEATLTDQTEKDAVEALRLELSAIVNDTSLSYEEKMSQISIKFKAFFKAHPSLKEKILSIEIKGFGILGGFLDVADEYFRIKNFDKLFIVASGETDCEMVVDMLAAIDNPSFNFTRSEKTLLQDFVGHIRVIAADASLSVEMKIKAIVYQYSQLMLIGDYLKFRLREFPIGVGFDFGTFGDLLDASDFGSRFAPTSPPTTSPAPTTTPVQGNCGSCASTLQIYNGNMTIFYKSCDDYLNANPGTQATNFRPYLTQCQNQIMNLTLTVQEKINKISLILKNYKGSNSLRIAFLDVIKIGTWGTLKQFQTCGGN